MEVFKQFITHPGFDDGPAQVLRFMIKRDGSHRCLEVEEDRGLPTDMDILVAEYDFSRILYEYKFSRVK